jgi:hypothetical protein
MHNLCIRLGSERVSEAQHANETRERNMRTKGRRLEATRLQVERWQAALRWRRRVDAVLDGSGLRFNDWLVLEATRRLVRETGDAVSQNQVATRLQVTRMCVTLAMRALERQDLVSRGGAMSGPAWRVYVTREGIWFLQAHEGRIEAASTET